MLTVRVGQIAKCSGRLWARSIQSLNSVQPNPSGLARMNSALRCQHYASESRPTKSRTLKEIAQAPASGSADMAGKSLLIGASVGGIGAICYYGLRLTNGVGACEKMASWPRYVRDRVRSTYMYFGMGIAATTASALAMARNPKFLKRIAPESKMRAYLYMAVTITSIVLTMLVPYSEGMGLKQLAWLGHSGLLGVVLAPICFMGGPILIKAACYTAGAVGGLSCVAMSAPSDKFLYMGGALAMGLGAIVAASIGSMFLTSASALGSGLYAVSLYGGLVAYWGFILYDAQMIRERCEEHPQDDKQTFDPINIALGILLDTTAFVFIHILSLLANGAAGGWGGGGGIWVGGGGDGGGKVETDQTNESSRSRKSKKRFWKRSGKQRKRDKMEKES